MREERANLWTHPADLICVTTNGFVKSNGEAVMGAGCAKELRDAVPTAAKKLGGLIKRYGNRPMRFCAVNGIHVCSFPVKHHWREEADPDLIAESAVELATLVYKFGYERVVLPRPGCGNGRLKWEDVKPRVEETLSDRFTVVTFPPRS